MPLTASSNPPLLPPSWCPALHISSDQWAWPTTEPRMGRTSSSTDSPCGTSVTVPPNPPSQGQHSARTCRGTHALPFIALDNGEGPGVTDLLHHLPLDCIFVFAINLSGFDELVLHFLDGSRIILRVEVCYDGVNHRLFGLLLYAYNSSIAEIRRPLSDGRIRI